MIECEKVYLRDYTKAIGWGGDSSRTIITSKDAKLTLDLQLRTLTVAAHRGESFQLPLEMVRQWHPVDGSADGAAPSASASESSPASAPARRSGTRRSRAQ